VKIEIMARRSADGPRANSTVTACHNMRMEGVSRWGAYSLGAPDRVLRLQFRYGVLKCLEVLGFVLGFYAFPFERPQWSLEDDVADGGELLLGWCGLEHIRHINLKIDVEFCVC
jgi:hypothetical protein